MTPLLPPPPAADAAPPDRSLSPPPLLQGLTARQALLTLGIVVVLGVLTGSVQLLNEWQAARRSTAASTAQALGMIQESAVEAAFQLNPDLAAKVVDGLCRQASVQRVVLRDNFGKVMAERERPAPTSWHSALDRLLFADVTDYELPLVYGRGRPDQSEVGALVVQLSPTDLGTAFIARATIDVGLWVAQALVICVLVVGVFYVLITQPLVRVARAIGQVDALRPAESPIPRPKRHGGDELGYLVATLNNLLFAFQRGLDQRDRADREVRALTRDLEDRVSERTKALNDAMEQLSREKEETERAFRRLDETHKELNRANGLVLESIHYARKIQDALLPDKNALGDGVRDIHVIWEPLHLVGGDYFWLQRRGGRSMVFVADCTGHGVPGAFMTMVVAAALDQILQQRPDAGPSEILETLDDLVRARLRQDRPDAGSDDGLDGAVCIYDPAAATVIFAGARVPLLYSRGRSLHEIRGDRRSLGYRTASRRVRLTDHVVPVEPGMAFYLFTDGIPDHMGGHPLRLLGRKRLAAMIASAQPGPLSEQLTALKTALDEYRGHEPRRDDMTLIGFIPA